MKLSGVFKIECYVNIGDNPGLVRLCFPPRNDTEIIYCLEALWHEGKTNDLKALLKDDAVKNQLIRQYNKPRLNIPNGLK